MSSKSHTDASSFSILVDYFLMKKAVKSVQGEIILGFAKFETFLFRVYGWFQFLEHTRLAPKCPLPEFCLSHPTLI